MNIKSIIAVTDFSPDGNAALDRAAQLAVRHRATLKLMSMPTARYQPISSATACLAHAARQLTQRYGLAVRPVAQVATSVAHLAEQAGSADLLVLPHRRERTLAALFLGQLAERLLRLAPCPVLVIKSAPRQRYGRVLVAVDFTPESRRLAEVVAGIDPESEVALFHALDTLVETRLRSANVSGEIVQSYRNRCIREARASLIRFTDSLDTRQSRILHAIGRGDPGRQAAVQQQHDGADLVVVGKRRRSTLGDFVFGSVARQVLRHATSDVLVVPYDFRSSKRAVAHQEIAAGRDDGKVALLTARGRTS